MDLEPVAGFLPRPEGDLLEVYRAAVELRRDEGLWCRPDGEYVVLRGVLDAISWLAGRALPPMSDGHSPPLSRSAVEDQVEVARAVARSGTGSRREHAFGVFAALRYALGHNELLVVLDVRDQRRTFTAVA